MEMGSTILIRKGSIMVWCFILGSSFDDMILIKFIAEIKRSLTKIREGGQELKIFSRLKKFPVGNIAKK
jgi:hypothetical protein